MRILFQLEAVRKRCRGFTLIELLVVVVIIGIMTFLLGNSFQAVGRSTDVSNGIQQVADTLNVARQIAVSRNEYTQVRIYGLPVGDSDPSAGQYSAISLFRADAPYYTNDYSSVLSSGKMLQVSAIAKLPKTCLIVSDPAYSPLFQTLVSDATRQLPALTLPDGKIYNGVAFYFKPDGSMDISSTNSSGTSTTNALSICGTQAFIQAGNKLPPNYGVINIDRVNGRFTVIRP